MARTMKKTYNYHTPVFLCSEVYKNKKPVLLVCKEDGDWQMLCGGEHNENDKPVVAGIGHLLQRDSSLLELLDLPDNWEAERQSVNDPWVKRKIDDNNY